MSVPSFCSLRCLRAISSDFQELPKAGPLGRRSNLSLGQVCRSVSDINSSTPIYCYVISSVRKKDGILQHYGCGPNWQGGLITLCTCKHYMRTFFEVSEWPGTWIAGFSNVRAGSGANVLIYMMRVKHAFESHYELWHALPRQVRWAKAADRKANILGDIYRPLGKTTLKGRFKKASYHQPCLSHVHFDGWVKDIDYKQYRRAAMLVGDERSSYVWSQPKIVLDHNIGRGQVKYHLRDLVHNHFSIPAK